MYSAARLRRLGFIVVVAVFAACSNGSERTPERSGTTSIPVVEHEGVPVLEGAIKGPGTPLGDGFTVARGTGLIGAVFPSDTAGRSDSGLRIADRGWRAMLLATGDPDAIMAAYSEQAAAVGLPLAPDHAGPPCLLFLDLLACTMAARIGTPQDGRAVRIVLHRRPSTGEREGLGLTAIVMGEVEAPPVSHMTISYSESGEGGRGVPTSTTPTTTLYDLPPPVLRELDRRKIDDPSSIELPRQWPPLVRSDALLRGGGAGAGQVTATVEPGSLLAAPTGVTPECTFETWAAVLWVTGEPRAVVAAYRRQFIGAGPLERVEVEKRSEGEATVYSVSDQADDGASYSAEAVVRPGEPTWMLIETCHD